VWGEIGLAPPYTSREGRTNTSKWAVRDKEVTRRVKMTYPENEQMAE
jgi:hypothetical protein